MADPKSQKFQTLTGMRDMLWPDSARRRLLVDGFVDIAGKAGYREVDPPLLENLGVFRRIGEETDVVTKEMYDFEDKDGSRIALRPEMTAGVARAFVQHKPALPWKVFYTGPNFRHERPQKGRYRAFDQVGVEVFGPDDPDVDVEVIVLAWRFFEDLGLEQVRLLVNTLGEHADRSAYTEAVRLYLESRRGDLSEQAQETLNRNPLRVLDSKRREDKPVIGEAPRISEYLSEAAAEHFQRVCSGLDALDVPYTVDDRLVRGLDYYRRTTFEFAADALDAAQNAIGGGGRYDGLVEDLGGPATDGIGFALGVDRILLACDAEEVFDPPATHLDAYLVDLTGGETARDLTHEIRGAGMSADRRFGAGSMKAQMKAADRSGARFAVIIGSDELEAGEVTVRTLRRPDDGSHSNAARGSGGGPTDAQQRIPRRELIEFLRSQK